MESGDLGPVRPKPGEFNASTAPPRFGSLVLRTPPNWTAVGFLLMLGAVHLSIAIPSLLKGRWEGYLSLILGTLILSAGVTCGRVGCEVAVLPAERRVRLRTGLRKLHYERSVPFSAVRGVRLTICGGGGGGGEAKRRRRDNDSRESLIELVCCLEDIECPPTTIPRQQALFLAMAMDVPLIKVSDGAPDGGGDDNSNNGDNPPPTPPRVDKLSARPKRI
jgi:hypothetical protein